MTQADETLQPVIQDSPSNQEGFSVPEEPIVPEEEYPDTPDPVPEEEPEDESSDTIEAIGEGEGMYIETIHKGGRPPIYDDVEKLQENIELYMKIGVKKKKVIISVGGRQKETYIEVPTITGLSYFLGFADRSSFYEYEKKEGFSYTIKRARQFIEKHYEELLQAGNTAGAIFALKNFGWKDKTETEHSGDVKFSLPNVLNDVNGKGDSV